VGSEVVLRGVIWVSRQKQDPIDRAHYHIPRRSGVWFVDTTPIASRRDISYKSDAGERELSHEPSFDKRAMIFRSLYRADFLRIITYVINSPGRK
jgi:hypothetical protein